MPSFFGFIPSPSLLSDIQQAQRNRDASEPMYPLRDKIAFALNDELLDRILSDGLKEFPPSDRKDTAEKLVGYVKSTVRALLGQLLGKTTNDKLAPSLDFIEGSIYHDESGQLRVGAPLDSALVGQMQSNFAAILAGENPSQIKPALTEQYKKFADMMVKHFMVDFNKTLDLGMIKRKAADVGAGVVTKAVHIAINKLIPNLTDEELKILAKHHSQLIHQTN